MKKEILHTLSPLQTFILLWTGQFLSRLGSAMTRFALMIWAYQQIGTASTLAMLGFYSCITFVLTSMFAGVLVDRWNRRRVMAVSDLGAGAATLLLLVLSTQGQMQIWHLYLVEGLSGMFEAFQSPAYAASVTLLVPREQFTRVNGLYSLSNYASTALAPVFAGLLLTLAGLEAVFWVDLVSMLLAVLLLLLLHIPQPGIPAGRQAAAANFRQEARVGFQYIASRPGLKGILVIFSLINLFGTISYFAILSPMILARSGGNTLALSTLQTLMGLGGIAGAVLVSLWGGSRERVKTFLCFTALSFLVCDFLFAVGQTLPVWILAGVISTLTIPFISSPYYAIWQDQVPAAIQGRVFSVRDIFQIGVQPIGYLLGGSLADGVFEPAMALGGGLQPWLGGLLGSGPGAGMAAMFLCTCVLGTLTGISGFLIPAVRSLEAAQPNVMTE